MKKSEYKKVLSITTITTVLVLLIISMLNISNNVDLHYNIENQVTVLQDYLNQTYGKKYAIYTACFNNDSDIPDIGKYNKNALLWLGNKKILSAKTMNENQTIVKNMKKFGYVLVTNANNVELLRILGIKAIQFPEFTINSPVVAHKDRYALVGKPPYIEKILKNNSARYQQYDWNKLEQLKSDLSEIKAIIVEQKKCDSCNINTTFLDAIMNNIPVIEYKNSPTSTQISTLGETAYHYYSENELKEIINKIETNTLDMEKNSHWIKLFFTKEAAQERLDRIVEGKEDKELSLINWDTHDTTGLHSQGDTWLIHDLIAHSDYKNINYLTFVDTKFRPRTQITVFVRGGIKDVKNRMFATKNILWLAYPDVKEENQQLSFEKYMEDIITDLSHFNKIAVASKQIQAYLKEQGMEAEWIPQFTNTDKFYPDYDETKKSEILFVGNNHFSRLSAVYAKKHNLPITIYGAKWPKGWAKSDYVDNQILRKYYSSAKIVLSDQKRYMAEFGVIVNRIFDATACNTLVISEYVPEIEQVYGNCIPMWKTEEEFVNLISYYLEHEEERKQKAQCAYEITLKNFTADIAAEKMDKLIAELQFCSFKLEAER